MTESVRPQVVLGYSGLDGSRELKESRFPDLEEREKNLYQGLDSAAALLVDGQLVAAVQQERFSGRKFDHAFPRDAIEYCLGHAGLGFADVDAVAHNFDYARMRVLSQGDEYSRLRFESVYAPELQTRLLHRHFPETVDRLTVRPVNHHRAHALSAAIPSGFDEALVVVLDGMGELHAVSVYAWQGGELVRLAALDYRSSLGLFYALVTLHLGFWPNSDEYKVMALAASGDPERFRPAMREAVELGPAGAFSVPLLSLNRDLRSRETFGTSRERLRALGCPPLAAGEQPGAVHFDLAAAAQERVEQAIVHLVGHWSARTGLRRLALAGGVALNCVAVGRLCESGLVDTVYVQPAAGDEGTAVGAALDLADPVRAAAQYPAMTFLGPDVDASQAPAQSPYWRAPVPRDHAPEAAAALIAAGCIVGWAEGRLEFGPRALGHRSILADPRLKSTRDRVNAAVKFREGFRPLAPAVKAEAAAQWFEVPPGARLRHMTVTVPVRPEQRDRIPAVVHDDGSARVQSVHADEVPGLWHILDHFERLTGIPVLMNTSLNVKGQPTARDGAEAYHTFASSHLDVAFIGDTVHAKPEWQDRVRDLLEKISAGRGDAGRGTHPDRETPQVHDAIAGPS
jgi:carbamoyltransferase